MTSRVCLLACLVAFGCTKKAPGERPTLTAAEHEAAAAKAEQLAEEHEDRRDPGLYTTQRCGPIVLPPPSATVAPQSGPSFSRPADMCGSSTITAARDHELEADRQRQIAESHRAIAAELRRAEEIACSSVPVEQRAMNPFAMPDQSVVAVNSVADQSGTGKAAMERAGVVVQLRGESDVSPSTLEARLNCQAAMAATADRPELASSPAAVPNATSSVWQDDGRTMIEVTSTDREAAEEIERRARALVPEGLTPENMP